jgi:basic membrane protein A
MLHRRSLRVLAVLVGLCLLTAACGKDKKDDASTKDTKASQSGVRVGVVYDVGGRGDQSFNDAAYTGLTKAEHELGVKGQDLEPSAGGKDREELLRTLAEDGYGLIIGVGFNFSTPMKAVAADFPDTKFAIVDDDQALAGNITNLVFAEEQGSYLVGAAAALTSKTGKLGFIGGVESPLIKKFEAGYVAGATKVKPNVSVQVKYISQLPDFSGFNNTTAAKEIATGLYGGGADVIFHAAGGSGGGLFEAAQATPNVWAIGVDSDQYLTADPAVKSKILTSMIKRVDTAVFNAIKDFKDGTLKSGVQRFDLSNDGIGYSTSGGFLTPEIKTQLEDLKHQIVAGTIEVPTTP